MLIRFDIKCSIKLIYTRSNLAFSNYPENLILDNFYNRLFQLSRETKTLISSWERWHCSTKFHNGTPSVQTESWDVTVILMPGKYLIHHLSNYLTPLRQLQAAASNIDGINIIYIISMLEKKDLIKFFIEV